LVIIVVPMEEAVLTDPGKVGWEGGADKTAFRPYGS
jgi:hypothetical protein